jgi:hypothetical protein
MTRSPTVHASAVLTGARAVLIRGPSGAGKSRLALALLAAATDGRLAFARLVGDDRCHLAAHHGRLLVSPAAELAGLIEVHGLGIRQLVHEPAAVVGLVVDLAATDGARMPADTGGRIAIDGIEVSRLAVAPGTDPLPLVLAALTTRPAT